MNDHIEGMGAPYYDGDSRRSEPTGKLSRLLALCTLAGAGLLAMAGSGQAAEPMSDNASRAALDSAVVEKMLGKEKGRVFGYSAVEETENTQTNVTRVSGDGRWAFGTAVIEAPRKEGAYPDARLFVAEKTNNTWTVALEGSSGFPELAEQSPTSVVDKGEKSLFAESDGSPEEASSSSYSASSYSAVNTGLRLPWKRGNKWTMTGGPHGWSTGYDRPYSSLDLAGGDGKVRSVRGGRVYTMCGNEKGYIRVYHRNGYATDYYHLRSNIKPRDGKWVKRGAFLGYTGEDVSCGGSASGRHVHFSLLKGGNRTALDNKTLGGWTFNQGSAYYGYAKHNRTKRYAGGLLRNYASN